MFMVLQRSYNLKNEKHFELNNIYKIFG